MHTLWGSLLVGTLVPIRTVSIPYVICTNIYALVQHLAPIRIYQLFSSSFLSFFLKIGFANSQMPLEVRRIMLDQNWT